MKYYGQQKHKPEALWTMMPMTVLVMMWQYCLVLLAPISLCPEGTRNNYGMGGVTDTIGNRETEEKKERVILFLV